MMLARELVQFGAYFGQLQRARPLLSLLFFAHTLKQSFDYGTVSMQTVVWVGRTFFMD